MYREKEVLHSFRDKLSHAKQTDAQREKQALLQSSSDEEEKDCFDEEGGHLAQEEEFEMVGREDYVQQRGSKIARVAKSLGQIQKMYQNLNEIVD